MNTDHLNIPLLYQEVFNNYGPKSNEELLINYGFVHPLGSPGALHGDWVRVTLGQADEATPAEEGESG